MTYRQIHIVIWQDEWFQDQSAEHKLLFLYLFSNDRTNLIGIYKTTLKTVAFETSLPIETVREGLASFATAGKAHFADGWMWVPNLLRYNCKNPNSPIIQGHMKRQLRSVPPACPHLAAWKEYYPELVPYVYPGPTIAAPKPHGTPEQGAGSSDQGPGISDQGAVAEPAAPALALSTYLKASGGAINNLTVDEINDLVDECEAHRQELPSEVPGSDVPGDEWVTEAIKETVANLQKPQMKYTVSILNRWRAEGYKAHPPSRASPRQPYQSEPPLYTDLEYGE
jgi:DnaD/phage-associated family protein